MRRSVALALVLAAGWTAPSPGAVVQVREAAVRDRPSYLGRIVATLVYGDPVESGAAPQGAWVSVTRDGRPLGWIHTSAVTRREVTMRSGDGAVDASVSTDELALAGKGFNAAVEAEYRARHGDAGYRELDRMEQLAVSPGDRAAFLREGGVTPPEGNGP